MIVHQKGNAKMPTKPEFELKPLKLSPEVVQARREALEAQQQKTLAETTKEIRSERLQRRYSIERRRQRQA